MTDPATGNATIDDRAEILAGIWTSCSNRGRWGTDDELGTLNYITDAKRVEAARLVRVGQTVSLARPIDTRQSEVNPEAAQRFMTYWGPDPIACGDTISMVIHGLALTHVDAIGHIFWGGSAYNGRRRDEIVQQDGLHFASVMAQGGGVLTRGVLLDIAATRGQPFLEYDDLVSVRDLTDAEQRSGVRVERGDALIVHLGLDRLEGAYGPSGRRPGLAPECIPWIHQREVAVYAGDGQDVLPPSSGQMPLPFHQICLPSMGLTLVDNPFLGDLVATAAALRRNDFLFTMAPLRIPGGTGSPVNPICVF